MLIFEAFKKPAASRPELCFPIVQKRPIIWPSKSDRFAPVVVVICCFQKGGRFAALVVVPNSSKETNYFTFIKAAASFAPVVVVIFCLQKGGRFAAVVVVANCSPIQKSGRFAIVQKRPIILPSKRRSLLKPSKRQLFILYLCSCPKKAAASRP